MRSANTRQTPSKLMSDYRIVEPQLAEKYPLIKITLSILGVLAAGNAFFLSKVIDQVAVTNQTTIALVEQVKALKELQILAGNTDKDLDTQVKGLVQISGEMKVLNYAVEQLNGKCSIKPQIAPITPSP